MINLRKYQERGKHCFIQRLRCADRCLKIFDAYPLKNFKGLDRFYWGDHPKDGNPRKNSLLTEATKIQNYAWWHGLAPRVYEIKKIVDAGRKYWAQEQEYIEGNTNPVETQNTYEKVKQLGNTYGYENAKDDVSMYDVRDNKLLDYNTFFFSKNHKEKIIDLYRDKGRYGKIYYHKIPELGLNKGPRDNDQRVKEMKLKDIDFKKKSVIDVGCAGGYFLRYAKDNGAKEVLGVDTPDTVEAAFIANNELGYWDIDYRNRDLTQPYTADDKVFDIAFFLSMNFHVPIPDVVKKAKTVIYEDNSKDSRHKEQIQDEWKQWFKNIKFIGFSTDHDKEGKAVYHCYK